MIGMIHQLKQRAEWHVRRTLMGGVGIIFVMIGGGFGVAAVWIALVPLVGAMGAALIIGAVFFGIGLLILALNGGSGQPKVAAAPEPEARGTTAPKGMYRPTGQTPPLMEAFLLGVSVYLETRNRRR